MFDNLRYICDDFGHDTNIHPLQIIGTITKRDAGVARVNFAVMRTYVGDGQSGAAS